MGLNESKKKDLEAKDFHKLFRNHKNKWADIAKKAHDYAKENITGGKEPRDDDVAEALLPILGADSDLKDHQRKNRAASKKFQGMFADYIVDQIKVTRGGAAGEHTK